MNYQQPDQYGHFGVFGGRFVPEILMRALSELEQAFLDLGQQEEFWQELAYYLQHYVGRPTPLYYAQNLSQALGGAQIYLKREDLNHTGAHKINNTLGQILLAIKMGKKRLIAETGAGMHGVATATVAARFNLPCTVYMGEEDVRRQAVNVYRMRLLGATVIPVASGSRTLKDATNEAFRDWMNSVENTFYVIGSVVAAHPYPLMVREFQKIIGQETHQQAQEYWQKRPDKIMACVGGGSNAIGIFHPFINDLEVQLVGVEAAGHGLASGLHAASLSQGSPGVFHGSLSYLLQDENGQIKEAHSISAGLDYPGVGPEHSYLKDRGRATYVTVTDQEAVDAYQLLAQKEGIIPALESAHALAYAIKTAPQASPDQNWVICLSGRGDKDLSSVQEFLDAR